MSLKRMLEETVARYGGKAAIVSGDCRLSYTELDEASNKVANALIGLGVNKGDRVAMLLSNSPEFVIIYFGITKIGAIAVPLDTKYKINELSSIFDNCLPKILVAEDSILEPLIPDLSRFKSIKQVIDLSSKGGSQYLGYQEMMAVSSAQRIKVEPEPEDAAILAYTSGPSFNPRGVVLSHYSLLTEAAISVSGFQQTEKDIMMLYSLPMHHVSVW
jgi:long-chain acyl-CoA synthetase